MLPSASSETETPLKIEDILETKKYATISENTVKSFDKESLAYFNSETSTWKKLGVDEELIIRLQTLGFKKPSKIQNQVIGAYKVHSKMFVQSQNGSGKTLAFSIPAVSVAQERKVANSIGVAAPQVVILADTNALILQLFGIITKIIKNYKNLNVDYLQKQHTPSTEVDILICTPIGLLNNHRKKKVLLDSIKMLIVDEADSALENDEAKMFFIKLIQKYLRSLNPYLILSSATNTNNLREIMDKVQDVSSILRLEKEEDELTLKNVQQYFIEYSDHHHKLECLLNIVNNIDAQNILIFDNSKRYLSDLHQSLCNAGQKTAIVMSGHGVVGPKENEKTLSEFMAGKHRILLTTNLLARGIDMRKVTLVINYSLPLQIDYNNKGGFVNPDEKQIDLETYLHRVGRTGRFGDHGIALNFIHSKMKRHIDDIEDKYKVDLVQLDTSSVNTLKNNLKNIDNLNIEKREFMEELI